jgi:hypothetical protein
VQQRGVSKSKRIPAWQIKKELAESLQLQSELGTPEKKKPQVVIFNVGG